MNGFFVGDIIGNSYTHENEEYNLKTKDFKLFTKRSKFSDDTILSFATIDWLLHTSHTPEEMIDCLKSFYERYPDKTPTIYGTSFVTWIKKGCQTFRKSNSNGAAMRASVIGYYANTYEELVSLVDKAFTPTHNNEHAKLGAEIVAYTIFITKYQLSKEALKYILETQYQLDLDKNIDEYRQEYEYTDDPIETVRPALVSLLNSTDYEDAIRNAVSFGGDTDTITSITSGIAEAFYGKIPTPILNKAKTYLPEEFLTLLNEFNSYIIEKK